MVIIRPLTCPQLSPVTRVPSSGCGQPTVPLSHLAGQAIPIGVDLPIGEAVLLLQPGQLGGVPGVGGVPALRLVVGGVDAALAAAGAHCQLNCLD